MRSLLAVIVFVSVGAPRAAAQPPNLSPAWTLPLDDATTGGPGAGRDSLVVAWSPTGNCLGIATGRSIRVVSAQGKVLWQWRFGDSNRVMQVGTVGPSPDCQSVALGGTVDYKYVWIANRNGQRKFLKTTGPPRLVRFSLDGSVVAVTTADFEVAYVLEPDTQVRWTGLLEKLPARWPSSIVRRDVDATPIDFSKNDAQRLLGLWSFMENRQASDDGVWVLHVGQPNHGPGDGWVSLFDARTRQRRWEKSINCPAGLITRDGQFVVAAGDLRPDPEPDSSGPCDSFNIYLFRQDGSLVQSWPNVGGRFISVTPDDKGFLSRTRDWGDNRKPAIERRDFTGEVLWTIPLHDEFDLTEISPDGKVLLVYPLFGNSVSLYRVQ